MNALVNTSGATALAIALLLSAAPTAVAHERHKQTSAAAETPTEEHAVSLDASADESAQAVAEATPRDHSSHESPADVVEAKAHDHAPHGETGFSESSDAPGGSNVPKPLAWLGKFHPPLTHFPIALLAAAALGELLFMRTGTATYRHAVLFCVRLGAGAAVLAVPLGWFFAGFRLVDKEWVMTAHRWVGTTVAVAAIALLALVESGELTATRQARFRVALFSATGLVGATGFLGGALLYGLDHYAW